MKKYIVLVILVIFIGGIYINYQIKNEEIKPENTTFNFTQDTKYQGLKESIAKELYKLHYKTSRLTNRELEQDIQELVEDTLDKEFDIATDNGKNVKFKIELISSPDIPQNAVGMSSTSMSNTVYFYN